MPPDFEVVDQIADDHQVGLSDEEFASLISPEFRDKLQSAALSRVHDYHDAQDVVQTAYERLLKHRGGFEGRSAPTTWMHRILINAAWTHHYRNKGKETVHVDELAEKTLGVESSPEELFEATELEREINQSLGNVHPSAAAVLRLVARGYTQAEIAKSFGITKNAVKIRIHRARKILAEELYN